jgi:hypothetical protein
VIAKPLPPNVKNVETRPASRSLLEASLALRDVGGITHRGPVTFWVERRDVIAKPRTQNLGLFEPSLANYGSGIADPAHKPQTRERDNGEASLLENDPSQQDVDG